MTALTLLILSAFMLAGMAAARGTWPMPASTAVMLRSCPPTHQQAGESCMRQPACWLMPRCSRSVVSNTSALIAVLPLLAWFTQGLRTRLRLLPATHHPVRLDTVNKTLTSRTAACESLGWRLSRFQSWQCLYYCIVAKKLSTVVNSGIA